MLWAASTPAVGFSRALRAEFGVPIWIDVLQASSASPCTSIALSSRPLTAPLVVFLVFGMNKVSTKALLLHYALSLVWSV